MAAQTPTQTYIDQLLGLVRSHSASQAPCASQQTQRGANAASARQLVLGTAVDAITSALEPQLATSQAKEAIKATLLLTRPSSTDTPDNAVAAQKLRSTLAPALLRWIPALQQQELAKDYVFLLVAELEYLAASDRLQLLNAALAALEEGRTHACLTLELVAPCLQQGVASETADGTQAEAGASQEGAEEGNSSMAHRDAAVHRLLHCAWRPDQLSSILAALRTLPMSQEQLRSLMQKAYKACRTAELQIMPPVMYQLLLLSAVGARSYCLRSMCSLFEHLEGLPQHKALGGAGPGQVLLQIEATVLMHINTVLKYDAALGPDWLKYLKGGGLQANTFMLQVAFAMCKFHRLEDKVLDMLKHLVKQAYEAEAQGAACSWLGSVTTTAHRLISGSQLEAAMLGAVRCSRFASELVAPGVVSLAMQLASSHVDCPLHLVLGCQPGADMPAQASADAQAARLGLRLLEAVFEWHSEARGEVLRVCQAQMASRRPESTLPSVLLLGNISRQQPALLCEHGQRLKDCVRSVADMGPEAALALLLALWPLCRVVKELQDYVVLVLRKVMFARDTNSRLVAVKGFLFLIVQQLRAGPELGQHLAQHGGGMDGSQASSSQASLSQLGAISPGGAGLSLLQELAGFLRKALCQQAAVRAALYEGLLQILEADPCAQECLAALLQPHLARLVEPDANMLPPLRIDLCASLQGEEAQLLEPLPALLACARQLTQPPQQRPSASQGAAPAQQSETDAAAAAAGNGECTSGLKGMFESVRKRLLECDAEHFDLDQGAELTPGTPLGLLHQMHVANLLGVLEVVIEDIVQDCCGSGPSGDPPPHEAERWGRHLLKLFRLHQRLYDLAREGAKVERKGKKRKKGAAAGGSTDNDSGGQAAGTKRPKPTPDFTPVELRPPQLSPACLARLCRAVHGDGLVRLPTQQQGGNEAGPSTSTAPPSSIPTAGDVNSAHVKLARDPAFRAFVLRSCVNHLEACRAGAAESALLDGTRTEGGEDGGRQPWLQLAEPLFCTAQALLLSARALPARTAGAAAAKKKGRSNNAAGSSGATAAADSSSSDSLEYLAARSLHKLLQLSDATQTMGSLMALLPLPPGARVQQAAAGGGDGGVASVVAAGAAEVAARVPHFRQMLDRLMAEGCFKEAAALCESLSLLGARGGAAGAAAVASAAAAACEQEEPVVAHVGLVKSLLELHVHFSGKEDLRALRGVVEDIQRVIGDSEKTTQEQMEAEADGNAGAAAPSLAVLAEVKTAQPAAGMAIACCEGAIAELERLCVGLRISAVHDTADASRAASPQSAALLRAVCSRTKALVGILSVLVNTIFAMPTILDALLRVLARIYKLLLDVAKLNTPARAPAGAAAAAAEAAGGAAGGGSGSAGPTKEFSELVTAVHRQLTPPIYNFLSDTQEYAREKGKQTSARIKREGKVIPNLVYNIETWEKQLLLASKAYKAKGVNLLRDAKRSTNRDFRITFGAGQGGSGGGEAGQQRRRRTGHGDGGAAAGSGAGGEDGEEDDDDDDVGQEGDQDEDGMEADAMEGEEEEEEQQGEQMEEDED